MYLSKKSLPFLIGLEEAAALVKKALKEKNWPEPALGETALAYRPCFLLEFEVKKENSQATKGTNALNPFSLELEKKMAALFEEKKSSLTYKLPEGSYPKIEKPKADEETIKAAAREKISLALVEETENVSITKMEKVYLPIWQTAAVIDGAKYLIETNAASGQIINKGLIPSREKGFMEIAGETLKELREPKAWLDYSKEIASDAAKAISKPAAGNSDQAAAPKSVWENRTIRISIALIILIILMWVFFNNF